MKIAHIFFIIIVYLFIGLAVAADNKMAATSALQAVDGFFVQTYMSQSKAIGAATKPILLVNGFNYQLYCKDNTVENFNGLKSPFNELKAISHIGPTLFAIGFPSWHKPGDISWKQKLQTLQPKIKQAIQEVDTVDWSNPAWPSREAELKKFMADSLKMVDNFITKRLQTNSFTENDYQEFSTHYMHTMIATMYLADLANTNAVIKQLKIWKTQLGADWNNLYVLIMGSKGRPTSELTTETNTAAITIASLMTPDHAKQKIIIMPMATDLQKAQATLGAIISAQNLARSTFITPRAKKVSGIHQALLTATVPLARENVEKIVGQKTTSLPVLSILPKDKPFVGS